ncbi:hypothetical protein E2C01_059806 [Portunus trituberculatus]|uniref:Uncharacterized protein n=1 Tax=Portunus trituberculatus TaxID=210409 RepID=A0A5B7H9G9_PORTR|nr:hypothetical protein [Portunus trituberculatus]
MSRPEGEAAAAGDTCRQTLLQEVFDQDYHVTDQGNLSHLLFGYPYGTGSDL